MNTITLNEQDKRDLLGWISGLGDASSNARAQQLLKCNRESIEFVLQLKTITAAFQPPADEGRIAELAESEAIAITEEVLDRADRIRQYPAAGRLRLVGWMTALAACIAIFILPTIWLLSLQNPVIGDATLLTIGHNLKIQEVHKSNIDVAEGSTIESDEKLAVISLRDGQRLILDKMTKLRIHRAGLIELQAGACLAEIPQSMQVKVSNAELKLTGAKAIIGTVSNGFSCNLVHGHASIKIDGQRYELQPGQRCVWKKPENNMSIVQFDRSQPARMEAATQPY